MGDLISRKELIEELQENIKIGFYGEFTDGSDVAFTIRQLERVINDQPTAYDVEKVVAELNDYYEERLVIVTPQARERVEQIVRNGGKE